MSNYQKIISDALEKVISENGYQTTVRNRDIHEQALAHRLAVHLEHSGCFIGYLVDCEYNKHGDNKKRDSEKKLFRPDIIIHIRGNDDFNLIMIETKKFNDPPDEITDAIENLIKRSSDLNYKHAFLVIFPEDSITEDSIRRI